MRIGSPRDFWAGAMFIAFGAFFALWSVAFYPVGTAVRMGPAYFPALLGALLAVLGGLIMAGSLATEGEPLPAIGWRPLAAITAGCVIYGYLMLVFVKGLALPFPLCPAFVDACPLG